MGRGEREREGKPERGKGEGGSAPLCPKERLPLFPVGLSLAPHTIYKLKSNNVKT